MPSMVEFKVATVKKRRRSGIVTNLSLSAATAALLATIPNSKGAVELDSRTVFPINLQTVPSGSVHNLPPLILSGSGSQSDYMSHRSHRSHSSHRSHYSSRGTPSTPRPKPTPLPPPPSPIPTVVEPKFLPNSIYAKLKDRSDFTELVTALDDAKLDDELGTNKRGRWTLLAPSRSAVAKAGQTTRSPNEVKSILRYHMINRSMSPRNIREATFLTTFNGQRIQVTTRDDVLYLDDLPVRLNPIECVNGTIYFIDDVLIPVEEDLVQVLRERGDCNVFVELLVKSEMTSLLEGKLALTVFTPNDDAFARLDTKSLLSINAMEPNELVAWLRSYIVMGRIFIDPTKREYTQRHRSLGGGILSFTKNNGYLLVDGAVMLTTNVDASNGVVHVIDRLLKSSAP